MAGKTGGVLTATAVVFFAVAAAHAQPKKAAPVAVATVVEREVAAGQTFVATVMPLKTSTVGSAVEGRVVNFLVDEGDRVEENQPLAQLRTKTLEIELAAAKAEAELRLQEFKELENGTRKEELDAAKARMLAGEALREYLTAKLRRTKTLFEKEGAISKEEFDEVQSGAVGAQQTLKALKATYELAVAGPRKEKIEQARARHRAQLEAVKRIEDLIHQHTIRAPFDGYVSAEHTEKGQWVGKGDPVAEILDLATVEIEVRVPEAHVTALRVGTEVRVTIGALPKQAFTGEIARIVPQADLRSRTFPVKVRVTNPAKGDGHLLKSGMLARVAMAVGERQKALLVPKDALVLGGPSPMVFVVDADPKNPKARMVRPVPVQVGVAAGGLIEVRGPLKRGQQVVVEGNERIFPGMPVIIVREIAN